MSLEGKVVSFPELKQKGKRRIYSFVLQAENLVREKKFFETTGKVQVFLFNAGETVSYGSRLRLRGKLALPKAPQNPGEFNYRDYLAGQGTHAVFEGYGLKSLKILSPPKGGGDRAASRLQELRISLSRRIDSLFSLPVNALLKALILGLRKDLPESFREDFVKTGTAHLIAISGMNITLVAGSLFLILICLSLPQKPSAVLGLFSTAIYVFLSGAGIPVVRAGWMAGLFFAGLLMEREKDLLNTLFFAFFAILVFDPNALFQAGFQLSFLSVFFLVTLSRGREWREGADFFQTGMVLIGTFPLGVAYFSVFSWTSLFANLLAIPLFNLGVMGGMASLLAGKIPGVGPALASIASLCLQSGLAWIHFWAGKPWGYFYLKPPAAGLILFYYSSLALIFLAFRFKKGRSRFLKTFSISAWLLAVGLFFLPSQHDPFALTFLSMGQNEVFHVEFPGRNHWLVNAGRGRPSDQAKWILTPLLRKKGIKHLQGVLLTDASPRHTGGLETILGNFSVKSVLFPALTKAVFLPPARKSKRTLKLPLSGGDRVSVQKEAGFEVLDVIEGNVFLTIYYGEKRFLFIPTWKPSVLKEALPRLKNLSFADVLILPASNSPPSHPLMKEILSLVLPHWVVFPSKKPVPGELLETLEREEIPFLFLSETGALRCEVEKGRLSLTPFHSLLS